MSTIVTPEPGYDGFAKEEHHHDYAGDTLLGFWIYIMSDCISVSYTHLTLPTIYSV